MEKKVFLQHSLIYPFQRQQAFERRKEMVMFRFVSDCHQTCGAYSATCDKTLEYDAALSCFKNISYHLNC